MWQILTNIIHLTTVCLKMAQSAVLRALSFERKVRTGEPMFLRIREGPAASLRCTTLAGHRAKYMVQRELDLERQVQVWILILLQKPREAMGDMHK